MRHINLSIKTKKNSYNIEIILHYPKEYVLGDVTQNALRDLTLFARLKIIEKKEHKKGPTKKNTKPESFTAITENKSKRYTRKTSKDKSKQFKTDT